MDGIGGLVDDGLRFPFSRRKCAYLRRRTGTYVSVLLFTTAVYTSHMIRSTTRLKSGVLLPYFVRNIYVHMMYIHMYDTYTEYIRYQVNIRSIEVSYTYVLCRYFEKVLG